MKNIDTHTPEHRNINYGAVISKHLEKQYPDTDAKELSILTREVIFAPRNYQTTINKKNVPITSIRENLADFIERDQSAKNFIPYSLNDIIADLIEQSSCETSSMNEYYRWVSATNDIIRNASKDDVSPQEIAERKDFISMSFDREAEILLCLSLYEGSEPTQERKQKIELLRFKLARLRELRSIVSNTISHPRRKQKNPNLEKYREYCQNLLSGTPDFNLILNLDINHNNDEDLEDGYSHLEYLRAAILHMMRILELPSEPNKRVENVTKQEATEQISPLAQSSQKNAKTR